MTKYEQEKERLIELEKLETKWDQFENVLEAILRMNITWDNGTPLTESDAFAILFVHAITDKDLNVLSNYCEELNEVYERIKDALDRCSIRFFVPGLKEFKTKYLLSSYESDRESISAVLEFMNVNYGVPLSESRNYVLAVENMAADMLLIKSVHSLSREDLIRFNVELLSSPNYRDIEIRENTLSERENELISKYNGTELDYRYDKDYLLIAADKEEIDKDKVEIRKKETVDYAQLSTLTTEELQDKLILGLCSSAVETKKQVDAYNAEKTLSELGIELFTKEDLEFLINEGGKLNALVAKKRDLEYAIEQIKELFIGSVEIEQLRAAYNRCLSLRAAFVKAGDDFNRYGNILRVKSSEYWELNKGESSTKIPRRKKEELLREKQQEINEASSKEKECGALYKEINGALFESKQLVIKTWADVKAIIDYNAYKHLHSSAGSIIDEIFDCESIEEFDELMSYKKAVITSALSRVLGGVLKEIDASETALFSVLKPEEDMNNSDVRFTYINSSINTVLSHESEMELVRTTKITMPRDVISDAQTLANEGTQTEKEVVTKMVRVLKYK